MMVSMRFLLVLAAGCVSAFTIQQPMSCGESSKPIEPAVEPDFKFENPETNCKYVSQPWIYDTFQSIATNFDKVFKIGGTDSTFRIMGHHPFAGHYNNGLIAYVNSLWRLNNCMRDQAVDAKIWGIYGGCDSPWSVMEFYFNATTNIGEPWEHHSLWVAKWTEDKKFDEVRTYIDGGLIIKTLSENEIYWNSTELIYHTDFVPGPAGLPPWMNQSQI